jgi:hypothetical protein
LSHLSAAYVPVLNSNDLNDCTSSVNERFVPELKKSRRIGYVTSRRLPVKETPPGLAISALRTNLSSKRLINVIGAEFNGVALSIIEEIE